MGDGGLHDDLYPCHPCLLIRTSPPRILEHGQILMVHNLLDKLTSGAPHVSRKVKAERPSSSPTKVVSIPAQSPNGNGKNTKRTSGNVNPSPHEVKFQAERADNPCERACLFQPSTNEVVSPTQSINKTSSIILLVQSVSVYHPDGAPWPGNPTWITTSLRHAWEI